MSKYLIAIFICFLIGVAPNESHAYSAGFKKLTYDKGQVEVALWYPSEAPEQEVIYWQWRGKAAEDSEVSEGKFPVLIFSHGMEGSMYNQSYLAEFMARNGYIVAAVQHNDEAHSFFQTLADRPQSIKRIIDFILDDPQIKTRINKDAIGMVGHSLGGYASFVIAGGKPDFSNHPSLGWMPKFLRKWYIHFKGVNNDFYDDRVKAIAVLAPGLGPLFNKESLSRVNVPVLIVAAEKDEVVLDGSASLYQHNLPKEPNFTVLKGAGHYTFLPMCTEYINKHFTEICHDPEYPREDLQVMVQKQVLKFFDDVF